MSRRQQADGTRMSPVCETGHTFFFLSKQTVTQSCGGNWLSYICSQREIADGVFKQEFCLRVKCWLRRASSGLQAFGLLYGERRPVTAEMGWVLWWRWGTGGRGMEWGQRLKSFCRLQLRHIHVYERIQEVKLSVAEGLNLINCPCWCVFLH